VIHFSQILEATSDKYPIFKEQLDSWDAEIFISVPCLIILHSLDEENGDKGICKYFYPPMYGIIEKDSEHDEPYHRESKAKQQKLQNIYN
jgi:hypothetical protein